MCIIMLTVLCCLCPSHIPHLQVPDDTEQGREDAVLGTILRGKASQAFRFIVCQLPVKLPSARLGPDADGSAVGIGADASQRKMLARLLLLLL